MSKQRKQRTTDDCSSDKLRRILFWLLLVVGFDKRRENDNNKLEANEARFKSYSSVQNSFWKSDWQIKSRSSFNISLRVRRAKKASELTRKTLIDDYSIKRAKLAMRDILKLRVAVYKWKKKKKCFWRNLCFWLFALLIESFFALYMQGADSLRNLYKLVSTFS